VLLLGLDALEWARPLGLVLLGLPVLLFFWLRRPRQPASTATGALALWREVESGQRSSVAARKRALPPRAWALLAALALGALAVASPRESLPPPAVLWRVLVDRSPSMSLPLTPQGPTSRYEAAQDAALAWLEAHDVPARAREWHTPGARAHVGIEPPAEWSSHLTRDLAAPDWSAWNAPDVLWVTDAVPSVGTREAALVTSGGEPVPGAVAAWENRFLEWRGESWIDGGAVPPRRVAVIGTLPSSWRKMVEIWAAERGWTVNDSAADAELVVQGGAHAGDQAVTVEGPGWRLTGRSAPLVEDEGEADELVPWWRERSSGEILAAGQAGRIQIRLASLEHFSGDPAAFGYSFARLLDECVPVLPGVVSFRERQGRGEPRVLEGAARDPWSRGEIPSSPVPPAAWLALASLVLAAVGVRLR